SAEDGRKTSWPSSAVTKPKPFDSSYHFTFPVGMIVSFALWWGPCPPLVAHPVSPRRRRTTARCTPGRVPRVDSVRLARNPGSRAGTPDRGLHTLVRGVMTEPWRPLDVGPGCSV